MPRIPEIGYRTQPVGPQQQPRMSAEAAGVGVGAELQQLGRGVSAAGEAVFDVQRKRALFEAELQSLEDEKRVRTAYEQAKQQAPEGADGFVESVTKQFDDWVPQALDKAPATHEAQRHVQLRLEQIRNSVLQDAMAFQSASRAARDTRRASEALDGLTNDARSNPENMESTLQRFREFAAMAPLPDEQIRGKFRDNGERQIMTGALDGWVTQYELRPMPVEQVDAAITALKNGAFDFKNRVSPPAFDQALTRLENRKKSLEVESTALYGKDFADTLAAIAVNGPEADPGVITMQRALEVRKGNAKLAERDMQQIEEAKRLYTTKQSLISMPFAKAAALSEEIRTGVQGAGAEYKARNYEEFERARRAVLEEYGRDKVAYTYRANPGIANAISAAEGIKDPVLREEKLKEGRAMLKQFQRDMGTPAWAVEVMGKGNAQQTAQALNGMKAEQAADQIEQLQRRYGSDWPLAMRELEEAKIEPGFLVLGRLDTPADVGWRKQLAGWMQEGRVKMRQTIGNMAATDIDSRIDTKIREFAQVFSRAGRAGQEIVRREREAMTIAAYGLAQEKGKSAQEAVDDAFNRLLGNRYDFGATYYTPKGELGLNERAADLALATATPEMFTPAAPGPLSDPRLQGPMGEAYRQRAAYSVAVQQGVWANSPTGDGLIRLAPDDRSAGAYSPVILANGQPWEIKFADVRKNPPPPFVPKSTWERSFAESGKHSKGAP